MLIEVPMPKMGESIMEGTVIKWYKNEGDFVKKDETLFEISTDKVDTEVPSLAEGILTKIVVKVNETVEVGKVVAVIETSGQAGTVKTEKRKEERGTEESATAEESDTVGGNPTQSETTAALTEVVMPKMGESVMEGTVIKWYKKAGDTVKAEETLFEISTDKVDTEVPSPVAGTVVEILVKEQETVGIGTVVARISTGDTKPVARPVVEVISMHDIVARNAMAGTAVEVRVPKTPGEENKSGRFLSPLVINIAKVEKIPLEELDTIAGSGIDGRVTKKDILRYIEIRSTQRTSHSAPGGIKKPLPAISAPSYDMPAGKIERIPMDNIRSKIMQNMVNSRDTSVHVTGVVEVDMTRVQNFIKANKEKYFKEEGIKLTYMPFIAMGVVKGLKDYPLVNSTIEETSILVKKFINIGIAVAVEPNGLIVPNIKSADEKNLIGMTKGIKDLAERARTKKLSVEDITGGTFTITNYGVFGSLFGTPIINQPEVAILGVGAVVKKPVVVEIDGSDFIAIKPMMYLSLSHDHRLVDGMLGGRFLTAVKEYLENFSE
ncbi:MAG: 2-oxoglutarate dehydrogenase, E2 component, dihydrolipoamide succinyltransferase [Ignavibacteriaceae bacterium]